MTEIQAELRETTDSYVTDVSFKWPPVGSAQQRAVAACLLEGDTSMPARVICELESSVAAYLDVPHVVAHCNGTSAMLSALYAAGVGIGDEVICPTYTWWASIAPVLWLGGVPVFCDIEPQELTLDVRDVERCFSPRTRAVVVPHLWGAAADIESVRSLAQRHGAMVIEDASHVFGTTLMGQRLGTFGDLGIFSMQTRKPLAAGEGGLLVTRSEQLRERSLAIGHYERLTTDSLHDPYRGTGLGLKFRMSALNAALACSYLDGIDAILCRQDVLVEAMLGPILARVPQVRVVGRQAGVVHGGRTALRLILPVGSASHIPDLADRLTSVGLPSQSEYLCLLHQSPFLSSRTVARRLDAAEGVFSRLLQMSLPVDGTAAGAEALGQRAARVLEERI